MTDDQWDEKIALDKLAAQTALLACDLLLHGRFADAVAKSEEALAVEREAALIGKEPDLWAGVTPDGREVIWP